MVLPIWRIEGANEPYAIPIFPGYSHYNSFPIYLISLFSTSIFLYVMHVASDSSIINWPVALIGTLYMGSLLFYFRLKMYEDHENIFLLFARLFSVLTNVKIKDNIEYLIYRAKLNVIETHRLKLDLTSLKEFALFLEDRSFYSHKGISLRGIARAIKQRIQQGRISGGSTITQQVARTLFIADLHKGYRRKILEIILSFWLERAFPKTDILEIYVTAVQYDKKVQNIFPAIEHFFEKKHIYLSRPQAFFLIERISNINSNFLGNKIFENIDNAFNAGIINKAEITELMKIYASMKGKGKIRSEKYLTIEKVAQMLNA